MWIDTHCHLAGKEFEADLPDVLARAQEAGIEAMIVIGAGDGLEGNKRATGLDYHHDHAPRDVQQQRFAEQIILAKEVHLPLVVHSREAWEDTVAVIEKRGPLPKAGVFHCFGGDWKEACQALDLGFYISISGIVTFKKAQNLVEVVSKLPLDKILIETDAPFLAPVPHRGKQNEPAFVKLVGEKVAEIKKMPVEAVSEVIVNNVRKLFALSPGGRGLG